MLSIGCVRRLQALTVMGWSMAELAKRCTITEGGLQALRDPRHRTTRPRFANIVTGLYEELWDQCGPATLAATRARNRGWLPPLAWDDDTIDDPDAQPDAGEDARRPHGGIGIPSDVLVENVQWLLSFDAVTTQAAADRFGLEPAALKRALERAGRQDLRDRLTRNSQEAAA